MAFSCGNTRAYARHALPATRRRTPPPTDTCRVGRSSACACSHQGFFSRCLFHNPGGSTAVAGSGGSNRRLGPMNAARAVRCKMPVSPLQRHRLEVGRRHDLEQLAVVGIAAHGMPDTRRLNPAGSFAEGVQTLAVKFRLKPTFQYIDHLKVDIVKVRHGHLFFVERPRHADHVGPYQAARRSRDAEVAIGRIRAQAGIKVLLAEVADDKSLAGTFNTSRQRCMIGWSFLLACGSP